MDLNKKLEELKPYQLNCNVFDVYSYNGLTMQDLLCQFFTKINECITVSNETIDLAKWLVNEGLEIEVVKKLMIWLEDGTLENIINVNLFNTLNEKINGLSSQLEHNVNELEILKTEKYLFVGDSYGMGYTPEGIVTNWCEFTKQLMHIADENYFHYAKGGYGFTNSGFQELLNQAISEIEDKGNVKYVIVGGGYNDAKNYNEIANGMQSFFNICKPNFPNAKIIIAPFGWCVEGLTTGLHEDQKISNLINMVLEYQRNAVIQGGCYIDGIYSVLHSNKFFSSDYVHPNQNGEYAIGLAIANYLKGNSFNTVEYMNKDNCFENNIYENDINNTIQCIATVDGKNTTLNFTSGKITGSFNDITLNGNNILIGTIRSAVINGCFNKTVIPLKGIIKTTDNKFYSVDFTLYISNNKLYINITMISDDNLDFKTLSFTEINVMAYSVPITINSLIN